MYNVFPQMTKEFHFVDVDEIIHIHIIFITHFKIHTLIVVNCSVSQYTTN